MRKTGSHSKTVVLIEPARIAWALLSVCAALISALAAQGQSASVTGTVDARGSGPLTAATVVIIDRKVHDEVVTKKAVVNGHYEVSVKPGSYEVFACDPQLKYEPRSRQVDLKSGDSRAKDIHLTDNPITVPAEDDTGKAIGPNVSVCVRHLESTCTAETKTDANGEITVPGPEHHFEVHVKGEQPCE